MIGSRIRVRRKALKISSESLTKFLGITKNTLYRYERGETAKFPVELLDPMAAALQTTVDYLLGYVKDPEAKINPQQLLITEQEQDIIKEFRKLNDDDQTMIINLIARLNKTFLKED